jgi:hypothetical protein
MHQLPGAVPAEGRDTIYCANCGAQLPGDANFCVRCGQAQRADLADHLHAKTLAASRMYGRWLMLAAGIVFGTLLLFAGLTGSIAPWGQPFFWLAALGIVICCVIVPQYVFRDRSPAPRDPVTRWVTLASASVGLSSSLVLWWGFRVASTIPFGGVPELARYAAVFMVLADVGLSLGLAYSTERAARQQLRWTTARNLLLALIGAQVLLNAVAELLWQRYRP